MFIPYLGHPFTVGFTLFQYPSGFVHQHLAPSVENDTKSCVGSLSFFHLHHESAKTQQPKAFQKNPRSHLLSQLVAHRNQFANPKKTFPRLVAAVLSHSLVVLPSLSLPPWKSQSSFPLDLLAGPFFSFLEFIDSRNPKRLSSLQFLEIGSYNPPSAASNYWPRIHFPSSSMTVITPTSVMTTISALFRRLPPYSMTNRNLKYGTTTKVERLGEMNISTSEALGIMMTTESRTVTWDSATPPPQKLRRPSILMSVVKLWDSSSSSTFLSADSGVSGRMSLGVWDTRVGCRISAILVDWGPQLGRIVGVASGVDDKVYAYLHSFTWTENLKLWGAAVKNVARRVNPCVLGLMGLAWVNLGCFLGTRSLAAPNLVRMELDLSPNLVKKVYGGDGESYFVWSLSELPMLREGNIGKLILLE
ncbi:hypothetical protein DVH24_018734 [Malus domestica]|uniref:Uncharacterized protein n=1 Tax=Malus domestica TaxID=3750 RepID=A0A498HKD8_MALDO|nr:hypothetical protein DVH24_018734 [Malus domestica]